MPVKLFFLFGTVCCDFWLGRATCSVLPRHGRQEAGPPLLGQSSDITPASFSFLQGAKNNIWLERTQILKVTMKVY